MSTPILYFAFANQPGDHLPLLKEEVAGIKDILRPLEQREFIKVEREESATTATVEGTLAAFPHQVAVFHYGGHAGDSTLELEGGAAHAAGLARLLGEQQDLKLVVLNGCSTRRQVESLLAAGVPAVIATSVPVADRMAVDFATAFYRALANKRTLGGAFEFAAAALRTRYRDAPEARIFRGIRQTPAEEAALPWGLYVAERTAGETLNWRLPYYRPVGLPADMIDYIGRSFRLNRYIVLILDEMCRYNKDIYNQMVEVRDGQEVKKDSSAYPDLVIQNFPWIIGSQLQLLRQLDRPDRDRLEQLLGTYVVTGMLLYYLLLNDYWNHLHSRRARPPEGFAERHRQRKENLPDTDFLEWTAEIGADMRNRNFPFTVAEYETLIPALEEADSPLLKARRYLEKLRREMDSVPETDLPETCRRAEQALSLLLRSAAWLADYRMLTVRGISIDNPRYAETVYEMNLGALNAIVNTSLSLYEDAEKRRKSSYSNCNSIVLSPSEQNLQDSLNLSPFIIDKNTFLKKENIDLFYFAYEEDGVYHYLTVKHNIFVALRNEKGTDIIHTDMTRDDFEEGRNIRRSEPDEFDFDDLFGSAETAGEESPRVFEQLAVQFGQFYSDFT